MLQLSLKKPDAAPDPVVPTPAGGSETPISAAISQLRSVGVIPRTLRLRGGLSAAGVAMKICARDWRNVPANLADNVSRVRTSLSSGLPLNLRLDNLGTGDQGIESFRLFCDGLMTELGGMHLQPGQLGLCVSAGDIPLPAFQVISTAVVGHGPRFVNLGEQHMGGGVQDGNTESDWAVLFARRNGPTPLWPLYDAGVRTRCPLLCSEKTDAVLPVTATSVPAGTAWLPIEIDVCQFADANGEVCLDSLTRAIDGCVEFGDGLFSVLSWPAAEQEADARLNRRLAVTLSGLGDLVGLRKQDPADLQCLRRLDGLVAYIHQRLWEKSGLMAEACGPLPALAQHHPAGRWPDETHHRDWTRRWQQALRTAQVRHRNLLVMSPYSIFPRRAEAQKDFVDLLPLIAHADALSFDKPPFYDRWKMVDFKVFHRRAWAITQRRNAASFVAAGV